MQQNNPDKTTKEYLTHNPNLLLTGSLVICISLFFYLFVVWLWIELT
jgi:hypothetical protein